MEITLQRERGRELIVEANEKAQYTAKLRGMAKTPVSKNNNAIWSTDYHLFDLVFVLG